MINNLLFDFTVDKATKTVTIVREFAAELPLVWMHIQNRKFLTNGGHPNHGYQKQNLWISKLAGEDFMRW